jgi:hypothetical protein
MQYAFNLLAFLFLIHSLFLVFFIRYRVSTIIQYCHMFKRNGLLSQKQFDFLESRYRSFMGYMESFPEPETHSLLYTDLHFLKFKKRSRLILRYLILSVLLITILLILIVAVGANSEYN